MNTSGSDYDTVLAVWTRSGGWKEIACNDDGADLTSALSFSATAGTTYYIQIGLCCGRGSFFGPTENDLHLSVSQ